MIFPPFLIIRCCSDAAFGISTFVYSRRRPFHPKKLAVLVKQLPTSMQRTLELEQAVEGVLDAAVAQGGKLAEPAAKPVEEPAAKPAGGMEGPLATVIRSKGFVWLATHHAAAVYWSHAGDHFELKNVGTWWAEADPSILPGGQLPPAVQQDFEGEFGDRRQEIVFIGVAMDEDAITAALDRCLLDDNEVEKYKEHFAMKSKEQLAMKST
eukprot:SAG31_NODE_1547_length_7925_cov_3.563251_8_plen_210_part_00